MIRILIRWLCVATFLAISITARAQAPAASAPPEPIPQRIDRIGAALQTTEKTLQDPDLSDAALADLRQKTEPLAAELQDVIERLNPQLAASKTRLDQLGPKPDEKAAPESPAVTAERVTQQDAYNRTDELIKRTRLLAVQADQTMSRIATRQHLLFTHLLFQSTNGIASPSLWVAVASEIMSDLRNVRDAFADWIAGLNGHLSGWRMQAFWGLSGFIFLLYWPLSRKAKAVLSREPQATDPSRFQKILAAWWIALGVAIVPVAALFMIALLFKVFELTNDRLQPFVTALAIGVIRIALTAGIARGLLAPTRPHWRLLSVSDLTAERIVRLALGIAVAVSVTRILESLNDIVGASLPISIALRGLGALIVAVLIGLSLKGLIAASEPEDECLGPPVTMTSRWVQILRIIAWAAVITIIASVIIGYVALAAFIVDQIVWASGVIALCYMADVLITEFLATSMSPDARISHALAVSIGIEHQSLSLVSVLLSGIANAVFFVLAILLILAPWGVQSADVPSGLRAAYFGLQVGGISLSLSGVATALIIFGLCYGATRAIQRWLDSRLLPQTHLDIGLRNSIKTSLGYLGFIIALLLALSYLGLNFERLAIVAGALSVGIGFGLQTIVNNFLSGLILLWERVIRVGDWIVIGDEQGLVRRINVRATEIETFDRALVIVPNANFVTGVVKNWVRTGRGGRLNIPLALGLGADPEKIRDTMLTSANAHELVVADPAPQVFFTNITLTSLNFELFAFVADVSTISRVKSDLYFDLVKRLKAAGIDIAPAAAPPPIVTITGLEALEPHLKAEGGELRRERSKNDERSSIQDKSAHD